MATFEKGLFNQKKPSAGDKAVEAMALGRPDRKSEAYEDYNGLASAQRRNNDVTVGGADILDNSGKLDEQIRLRTKSKHNETAGGVARKILGNSGQHPNIKNKSQQIGESVASNNNSKSILKRTQKSNLLAASGGSLQLKALQDKVMGAASPKMASEDGAFNLFTHQQKR